MVANASLITMVFTMMTMMLICDSVRVLAPSFSARHRQRHIIGYRLRPRRSGIARFVLNALALMGRSSEVVLKFVVILV